MSDLILVILVVVPTVAFSILWVLKPQKPVQIPAPDHTTEILFRDGVIEHATDSALAQLPIVVGSHNWADLHDILIDNFPEFPATPQPPYSPDAFVPGGCSQTQNIVIRWNQDSTTIVFRETNTSSRTKADFDELDTLRQINALSPHPTWKSALDGSVIWHNKAYATLRSRMSHSSADIAHPVFEFQDDATSNNISRIKVEVCDADLPEWFDVAHTYLENGAIHRATSLTALIKAEDAQRDFVQTLAKTFAHLSIGLAIFNRDRQLALFNPALIDLTGLPVSFLSPRPTIGSFFDALRENRRMPEPKNYRTWRQRMADLVTAAEDGKFEETWTLETGQTYTVKGRPHPNGAIAFLIEDISAEISLTRNFRAELELGQSLVDTFEDALAVFSQSGVLTFSNKAYDRLWGFEFDTSFADVTIGDAIHMWKEKSASNPLWKELEETLLALNEREEWSMPINVKGQFPMTCKVVPITSGATVVRFARQGQLSPVNLPMIDNALS